MREFEFLLKDVFSADAHYAGLEGCETVVPELLSSILEGARDFAEGVVGPLYRVGDQEGCSFDAGQVSTPEGFSKAFQLYGEGGWQGLTLAFFVIMMKKLAGRSEAILLALAFPAVFVTIGHGQNAFLTAGLFAGALHYLNRKPVVAGLLIGLLTFKPHLGLLIPFVLMVSRCWRVFFSASVTSISFAAMSWLILGSETWAAFFSSTSKAASRINDGMVPFYKMQSLFASLVKG